MLYNMRILR